MNKPRRDLVFCFVQSAGVSVCKCSLRFAKPRRKFWAVTVTQTETGSPKQVFFITVTARLQSRDIQVTDSDTNLCTQVFTACVSKGQYATKSVFNGQWGSIVGVHCFLLNPCTCVILDGRNYLTISP